MTPKTSAAPEQADTAARPTGLPRVTARPVPLFKIPLPTSSRFEGIDTLHLAVVGGLTETTAIRYSNAV